MRDDDREQRGGADKRPVGTGGGGGGGAEAAHLSPVGKELRVAEPRANSGRGTQVGRSLPQRVKQIEESQ